MANEKAKREAISKRKRFEIFKRDGFKCQYCGRTPPAVVLQIDHVVPVSKGGLSESFNLITACEDCNGGKSDRSLHDIPLSVADEIERHTERAEQIKAFNRLVMKQRKERDVAIREIGRYWYNQFYDEQDHWSFGKERVRSMKVFIERMSQADIYDAIDIAMFRKPPHGEQDFPTWKYFCGVCWKKIRGEDHP